MINLNQFLDEINNIVFKILKSKVEKISFLGEGRLNKIYLIHLINQKKVVLKIQNVLDKRFQQGFGKEKEIIKLGKMEKYVPNLYYIGHFEEYKFSILEYIEGEEANILDDSIKTYLIGKTLRKIHDLTEVRVSRNKLKKIYKEYLLKYILKINYDKDKKILLQNMKRLLKNSALKKKNICLLHHDFHFKNIIFQAENKIKIIDWDSSRYGIDEIEFIKFKHLNFINLSKEQQKYFIEGYNNIQITPLIIISEILWLIRMREFEKNNRVEKNYSYFPSMDYYEQEKKKLIKKLKNKKIKNLEEYLYF